MKRIFTLLILCVVVFSANSQTIYFQEGFDNGLPPGWTADDEWLFDTPSNISSQYFTVPEADGNVACFNDDGLGNGVVGGGMFVTSAIDLTSATGTVILEMQSYFPNLDYQGNDETAKISISSDMGTTWTEVDDLVGGEGGDFSVIFYDISSYAGETVMLQFVYDDGDTWNYGWAVDNITIADQITLIAPRSFGLHAGSSVIMAQALDGIEYYNDGFVYNNGLEEITSFDIELSNGTDVFTQSFTDVSIPYNTIVRYSLDQAITVSGDQEWTVTLKNVNGSSDPDEDPSDDAMSFDLNAVTGINPHKGVMIEEATGTWCTWCPRGAVYLDEMSKRFGKHFVGIAVHNADPMAFEEYDDAITDFPNFPGFPSVVYQRESILDPDEIVDPSIAEMQVAPPATIEIGASLDGNDLTTSIGLEFLEDVTEDYSLAIILTEDGLTGTTNDWAQINAYSGGGFGPMGGYELLPSAVPPELMVYDHVGRALIGGFPGVGDTIVGAHTIGEIKGYVFDTYTIPAEFVMDNMHIVGALINSDGEIVNSTYSSIDDAVNNGLFVAPVSTENIYDSNLAEINPNPVKDIAYISMSLDEANEVKVTLMNAVGQQVSYNNYGTLSGTFNLEYDMSNLVTGMYFMHIQVDNKYVSKKITKVD